MGLNINKRLRYFKTEADYEAFVEQQRAEADAGTLALFETTVCCITGDREEKPDTYLPSHDVGDEDKIMHYNAEDEIRYIPFINPMWTDKNCILREDGDDIKPTVPSTITPISLSDVVDGQTITKLDSDFFEHISSFPKFSVKNVRTLNCATSNLMQRRFSFQKDWPSLVAGVWGNSSRIIRMPTFEDNEINAPLLESISIFGQDVSSSFSFPVIKSQSLKTLSLFVYSNYDFNIDEIIPYSMSTVSSISVSSIYTNSIVMHHTGDSLKWSASYGLYSLNGIQSDEQLVPVTLSLHTTGQIASSSIEFRGVNFHGSSFDGDIKFLYSNYSSYSDGSIGLNCCGSTAEEEEEFCEFISHKNKYIRFSDYPVDIRRISLLRCFFKDIVIDHDVDKYSNTLNLEVVPIAGTDELSNVVLNITGTTERSISIPMHSNVTINLPEQDYYFDYFQHSGSSYGSTIGSLKINGVLRARSVVSGLLSRMSDYPDVYLERSYGVTVKEINAVKLHSPSFTFNIDSDCNGIIYLEPYYNGYSEVGKDAMTFNLTLTSDFTSLQINVTSKCKVITANLVTANLSISSINKVLDAIEPVLDNYLGGGTCNVRILQSYKDQIDLDAARKAIFDKFATYEIIV